MRSSSPSAAASGPARPGEAEYLATPTVRHAVRGSRDAARRGRSRPQADHRPHPSGQHGRRDRRRLPVASPQLGTRSPARRSARCWRPCSARRAVRRVASTPSSPRRRSGSAPRNPEGPRRSVRPRSRSSPSPGPTARRRPLAWWPTSRMTAGLKHRLELDLRGRRHGRDGRRGRLLRPGRSGGASSRPPASRSPSSRPLGAGCCCAGMGVATNDVSVVTNVTADHLGLQGIDTLDQLAEVKAIVTTVTKPDGWVVLNGEDPRVWAMRHTHPGQAVGVQRRPGRPRPARVDHHGRSWHHGPRRRDRRPDTGQRPRPAGARSSTYRSPCRGCRATTPRTPWPQPLPPWGWACRAPPSSTG